MMDGGYGTSQMPLAGAILCCTSIPPEQRTELGAIGAQMGATIKLDLTSDVTHLIVGSINSAKYRYVAKSREDVKVLTPEWLEALRVIWMEGGDVDVAALEKEYRLPTFYGLKICLTGFDDPDQRKYIQETANQNGAEYHGDLTKNVTHLIAATPSGKKYEHAVNWRMKIVSWEWFEQSMQRGMALDETYYNPTMPVEERGKGAWDRKRSTSPTLGKRTRDPEQIQPGNALKRKLRRSASSKMGSQSEALWAGITAGGYERQQNAEDDWTDHTFNKPSLQNPHAPVAPDDEPPIAKDDAQPENPAHESHTFPPNNGIFKGRVVFAYGFDLDKTNILQEHLASNGATVIRNGGELSNFPSHDLKRGFLVVPHDVQTDLTSLPATAGTLNRVTNWWVERCLHAKCLVDPAENILCRPFDKLGVSGFDGLTINSTAFTGIELLHLTKVVSLMGATYDEYLTTKTSVLVCNTQKPNAEKIKFATDKRIPAVHATWLWNCLHTGELQPFEKFLLNTLTPISQKPRPKGHFSEIPTAPLSSSDSAKLHKKNENKVQLTKHTSKAQPSKGPQRSRILDLAVSANSTPASTTSTGSSTHPNTTIGPFIDDDDDEPTIQGLDGPASLPLQDLHPDMNSPRRPSNSSDTSTIAPNAKLNGSSKSTTRSSSVADAQRKSVPTARTSTLARDPTPDSVIPPLSEPVQEEKDYTSIMSNLLAQRKAATEHNASNFEADKRKLRRRQLGRATSTRSNPSTADAPVSRAGSEAPNGIAEEEVNFDSVLGEEKDFGVGKGKGVVMYQPSQELSWDALGAQEAREQMIRAIGGKVLDSGGVVAQKPIGVVKDVVSGEVGLGRASRRRRG